jgi:tRNA (guanosine-2'-O-)-methyltransferase
MKPAPRIVIDALSPILGEERLAKIDRVAASRLAGLVVVLENLHDPHNGGAALRSSEGIGVLEVHTVGNPLRFSERVTQGCEKWLNLEHDADIDVCARNLKARGFRLYAAVPGAEVALESLDPITPAAFLIGNEHAGLTARAQELADQVFAIPLHGFSQSVNLSVATALTVYTHARRRRDAFGRVGDLDEQALLDLRASYYRRDVRGADAIIARYLDERGSAR